MVGAWELSKEAVAVEKVVMVEKDEVRCVGISTRTCVEMPMAFQNLVARKEYHEIDLL